MAKRRKRRSQTAPSQVRKVRDDRIGDGRIKLGPVADPRKEYVSGGRFQWTQNYLRSLPFYIDDLTRDFGDDLYERMLLDPQVSKCLNVVKMSVLADGIHLTPALPPDDPEYDRAQEICAFCQRNLAGLDAPFDPDNALPLYWQVWNLLDGIALGNKVAEQVYELRQGGTDDGKLCLSMLKVKPRRAIAIVVDVFLNIVGLLGLIPGQGATVITQSIVGDPNKVPNLLPRRKFAIFSFRPVDSDPRGTSLCRAAYEPWWSKRQVNPERLKHLGRFGSPSVVATLAEQAKPAPLIDPDSGQPVLDDGGNPVMIQPTEAMLQAAEGWRNGSCMVVPYGSKVEIHEPQGSGEAFSSATDDFNREISNAMLSQTLATEEGEHQARASSQTHQDVLSLIVGHGKYALAAVLRKDILANLVEFNYGADALPLVPVASLSVEQHDFPETAKAISDLEKSGYLDPEHYPHLDGRLGLPARSAKAMKRAMERKALPAPAPADEGEQGTGDEDTEEDE